MAATSHTGLVAVALASLLGAACSSAPRGEATADTATPDTGDAGGDLRDDDASPDALPDVTPSDTGGDALPDAGGSPRGTPCEDDSECASGICIDLVAGPGGGLCTIPCATDETCGDGHDCVLVTNSGGDAIQVCVPLVLCVDGDGDGYGVGPDCIADDCDDDVATTNPGAPELCNDVDDDCDEIVDADFAELGADCVTAFPGACAPGTLACEDGAPRCVQRTAPADETCNDVDDDCDGTIDDGAGCYPRGAPCAEDADCVNGECEGGFCTLSLCGRDCPDRVTTTPGGDEALRSERYVLDLSTAGPPPAPPIASERFVLRLGTTAWRDPR